MILEALAAIALAGYSTAKALEIKKQVSEIGLIDSAKRAKTKIADAVDDCRAIVDGVRLMARQRRVLRDERLARDATQIEKS